MSEGQDVVMFELAQGLQPSNKLLYACRPNVLERFAVMNAQLHSITGQMVPLMEHYVVHPKVTVAQ